MVRPVISATGAACTGLELAEGWGGITATNTSSSMCPTITVTNADWDFYRVALKAFKREDGEPMKGLFNVIVVSKKEEILLDKKVVAEDAREAEFIAEVADVLKAKALKPRDVTVICNRLGDVSVEKEPEKVRLVKDE